MSTYAQCKAALDQYESDLARRANVVGLGIVEADGTAPDEYRLAVYVDRKRPPAELAEKDIVPGKLPMICKGKTIFIDTVVIELGPVTLQ